MKTRHFFLSVSLCLWCSEVGADESKPPSANFDLSHWKLTLPVDSDGVAAGKSMEIMPAQLSEGYARSLK